MTRVDLTAEQFLQAIPKSGGIISTIALKVGCAWDTARKFIDTHPTVLSAYQNECETVKDMAESKLIASMNEGDIESIKWYLARKAKDRGYAPGVEVTGKDGGAQRIIFEYADGDDNNIESAGTN